MTSRTFALQQYIGKQWGVLKGEDRKKAREIARRGNGGKERQLDLGQLPVETLEDLYGLISAVVERVWLEQRREAKRTVRYEQRAHMDQRTLPEQQVQTERRAQVELNAQIERVKVEHGGQTEQRAHMEQETRIRPQQHTPRHRPLQYSTEPLIHQPQQPSTNLAIPTPDQLQNVIMTADSSNMRAVFLELCYCSPALARAAVRCLAPHSTFARSTLRRAAAPPERAPALQGDALPHSQPQTRSDNFKREPYNPSERPKPSFRMPDLPMPSPVKQERGEATAPNTVPKMNAQTLAAVKRERVISSSPEPLVNLEELEDDSDAPEDEPLFIPRSKERSRKASPRQPLASKSTNLPAYGSPGAFASSSMAQKRKARDTESNTHTGTLEPDWDLDFWLNESIDAEGVDPNEGDNSRYFKYTCCQRPGISRTCGRRENFPGATKRGRWSTGGVQDAG